MFGVLSMLQKPALSLFAILTFSFLLYSDPLFIHDKQNYFFTQILILIIYLQSLTENLKTVSRITRTRDIFISKFNPLLIGLHSKFRFTLIWELYRWVEKKVILNSDLLTIKQRSSQKVIRWSETELTLNELSRSNQL